ncbi:MAG: NifB/NifX family molybdenum-iron cluster-binding protein [Candidatus Micrarchaeota archaeon]
MRVIIPVLPQKEGLIISQHFGRAPEFAIFEMPDIEKPKEVFKNTASPTMKEHSGRGRLVLEILLSKNFDAIITKEIGPGAFYELKSRGIKIYHSNDRTPKDALEKLLKGELTELTAPSE